MEKMAEINKPEKFQAIAIIQLVSGILEVISGLGFNLWGFIAGVYSFGIGCLLIPFGIYLLVVGTLAIISGAMGLGGNPVHKLYKPVAIMQIVGIICCDAWGLISGILCLIFLSEPAVKDFLKK
jgi:hypothetical protein